MHFAELRAALGQATLLCAALGLFVSVSSSVAQELPSVEPLDAKSLAKRIRKSIVVLTQIGRDDEEAGVGTGFVVSGDGLIATSLHVVGEGRPLHVRLANGEEVKVTSVHAWDRTLDLAVLRVDKTGLPALPLGDLVSAWPRLVSGGDGHAARSRFQFCARGGLGAAHTRRRGDDSTGRAN